jgi:hypothetical protein
MGQALPESDDLLRIAEQRKARRDLTLGAQPLLEKIMSTLIKVLQLHLCFVFAWMLLGSVYAPAARLLAKCVSPLAEIAFFFYRMYSVPDHFRGTLGHDFYRSIVGETFFVGIIVGILFAVVYFGRYWRKPWRFSQFFLEQLGTRASWSAILFSLLLTTPFCLMFGLGVLAWYGVLDSEPSQEAVALHQLGLWSIFSAGSIFAFLLPFFVILSGVFFLFKKIWDSF